VPPGDTKAIPIPVPLERSHDFRLCDMDQVGFAERNVMECPAAIFVIPP
jgi:hypothetical protein